MTVHLTKPGTYTYEGLGKPITLPRALNILPVEHETARKAWMEGFADDSYGGVSLFGGHVYIVDNLLVHTDTNGLSTTFEFAHSLHARMHFYTHVAYVEAVEAGTVEP